MEAGRLLEDCTPSKLVPSLETLGTTLLTNNANHHEHLVALSIVIMREMGFRVVTSPAAAAAATTIRDKQREDWSNEQNELKCLIELQASTGYQLRFRHESKDERLDCKLVAVPAGDVLIINLIPLRYSNSDISKTRNIAISSYKYVNPHSSDLAGRFMNLRELSHRLKDSLVSPMKGEILTSAGITNASLSGLPTELKINILRMLRARDIARMAKSCREFRHLCRALPSRR